LVPLKLLVATVSAKTKKFVWSRRLAVDSVAEDHVVRRDRLGDRSRGSARLEELARHLLAGADFRERSVLRHVEIYRKRLLIGGQEFLLLVHPGTLAAGAKGCNPFLCHFFASSVSTGGRRETG